MSREQKLIEEVLDTSYTVHPNYTHNQHLVWALGLLAATVVKKNHMDNIVFKEFNDTLNTIRSEQKYGLGNKA